MSQRPAPVETVTFALVDVPDADALAARLPDDTARAMSQLDGLVRRLARSHGGYLPTGRAARASVAFHDAPDALHFAVDLQRLLLQVPWPERLLAEPEAAERGDLYRGLRARTALHTGVPQVRADVHRGRMRYFGAMPRTADAVLRVAQPGQIVATGATWTHLHAWLGEDMTHEVLGRFALDRGIPVALVQLLPRELSPRRFAPPAALRLPDADLAQELQADVMDHALLAVGGATSEGEA